MNSHARSWTVTGMLSLTFVGGTLIAVSAVEGRKGGDGAHVAGTTLLDTLLCVFVPEGAPAGYNAEVAHTNARMHQAMNNIRLTGDPDRDFARRMIPHHQGAIDAALIQLKYGRDERLRRLAQAIIVEQGQEVAYLQTILDTPPGPSTTARVARQ